METWKQILNSNYYIDINGRVKRIYKNGKERLLKTHRKHSIQVIKLTINRKSKDYNVARLVVENFGRKLNENEVVMHKNGIILDNRLENLKIATKSEAGKITGQLSSEKTIILIENGEIKKIFKSTRQVEKELFISRQTVSDYCNNKVKNKMFNLVWAEDLI